MAHATHTQRPHGAAETSTALITTKQAANVLNLGVRTLQELAAKREIPIVKIGKSVRYDMADLLAFIERKKLKATGWAKV